MHWLKLLLRSVSLGAISLASLSLVGCTNGSAARSAPPPISPDVSSEVSTAEESVVQPHAPSPAPASAPAPVGESHARAEPSTRPGLGTQWGETRYSHVRDVDFERAQWDRPFAVATMNYNDRRGVDAMAAHVAHRVSFRDLETAGGAITVSLHDERGEPLEATKIGDRTLVVGRPGERYNIILTNHTEHRFEAVATVDGLDVINGRPGTLENRGYVLLPYATLTIDGFRQNENAVAAFRFASVGESYAAQTGSARNVGVIGVAFFAEAGDSFEPYGARELYLRDTAIPFPGSDPRYAKPPPR